MPLALHLNEKLISEVREFPSSKRQADRIIGTRINEQDRRLGGDPRRRTSKVIVHISVSPI
jgi:hypothetical protein